MLRFIGVNSRRRIADCPSRGTVRDRHGGWRSDAQHEGGHRPTPHYPTGARREFGSINLLTRASQIKLAVTTSDVGAFLEQIRVVPESLDVALVPRHREWRQGNHATAAQEAMVARDGLPRDVRERVEDVSALGAHLGLAEARDCTLHSRAGRAIGFSGRSLRVTWSWRLSGSVSTTRRFGEGPGRCGWGCYVVGGGDIRH